MKKLLCLAAALLFCATYAQQGFGEEIEVTVPEGTTVTVGTPVEGDPKAFTIEGTGSGYISCGAECTFKPGKDARTLIWVIPDGSDLDARGLAFTLDDASTKLTLLVDDTPTQRYKAPVGKKSIKLAFPATK